MTTITDTLYLPNGQTFRGTVTVTMAMSQPLYTSGGRTLTQLSKTVNVTDGAISLTLEPNANITPSGTSYLARYSPASGSPYTEYWVVPASGPVTVADCRVAQQPTVQVLLRAVSAPPATASSAGTVGTITYDSGYIYIAVSQNQWKRVAISSW